MWNLEKWTSGSVNLLRSYHNRKMGWTCQVSSHTRFTFGLTYPGIIRDRGLMTVPTGGEVVQEYSCSKRFAFGLFRQGFNLVSGQTKLRVHASSLITCELIRSSGYYRSLPDKKGDDLPYYLSTVPRHDHEKNLPTIYLFDLACSYHTRVCCPSEATWSCCMHVKVLLNLSQLFLFVFFCFFSRTRRRAAYFLY